jgi:hypothetical protein
MRGLRLFKNRFFWRLTLDFDGWCDTVLASVVGTRRKSHMKLDLESNPESFRGQKPDKNRLPSDLIASRSREAALCFEKMQTRIQEPEVSPESFQGSSGTKNQKYRRRDADCGDRDGRAARDRTERRSQPGKGGQAVRKWSDFVRLGTGSTRLFPHNSTQVVDFPHLAHVRLFGEAMKRVATDGTPVLRSSTAEGGRIKHGCGKDVEQEGTEIGRKRTQGTQKMGNSTGQSRAGSGRIRILVAIFVNGAFAYVRLCSLKIAYVRHF